MPNPARNSRQSPRRFRGHCRPRILPSPAIAPVAQHRGGEAQLACDLDQRPTAARQQSDRLRLVLIRKMTPFLAHSTPFRSRRSLAKVSTNSGEGRGHLPSPWRRLAQGQCRAREPRSAQGYVGDRAVSLGCSLRPCRALRGLRPPPNCLQLLSQPPLPEVSRRGGTRLACRPRSRSAAGRLLPPGLHPAGRDRPDRLPEQGGSLRPAVPRGSRNAAHHRRRSQASWCWRWRYCRAPYLGLGDDPPSVRLYDRAGRRDIAGRLALDILPTGLLLPVRVLSRLFRRLFLAGLADAMRRVGWRSSARSNACALRPAFDAPLAPLRRKNWFVYAKPPFAGPEAVLAYLARYPHRVAIAKRPPPCSRRARRHLPLQELPPRRAGTLRTMTLAADEFIRRFLLHALPKGFTASPLRAARQRRLQGQYRARQGADRRPGAAGGAGNGARPRQYRRRCRRSVSILSLLRRSYDHHQDLRARRPAIAQSRYRNLM
jgi:hypothetical protein